MRNLHRAGRLIFGCTGGVAAALLAFGTASAGPVRGTLELPRDAQPTRAEPTTADHYWRVWNGVLEPRPVQLNPAKELLVVLTAAEAPAGDTVGCEFNLRGGGFEPSALAVRPGSSLTITNTDGFSHVLVAASLPGFERAETPPGNARVVEVSEAGTFGVIDENFPSVAGTIHALPGLVACAQPNPQGGYTFADVPPGAYTLRVLRGEAELASRDVTVAASGELVVPAIALTLDAEG